MFGIELVRDAPHVVLKNAERENAEYINSEPLTKPAAITDSVQCSNYISEIRTAQRSATRKLELLTRDSQNFHVDMKAEDKLAPREGAKAPLSANAKIRDYLMAHPEESRVFGLGDILADKARIAELDECKTDKIQLDRSMVDFLKANPTKGRQLGSHADVFRRAAQISVTKERLERYKLLLGNLDDLKNDGRFSRSARVSNYLKDKGYGLAWWVKDHRTAGGGSVIAIGVLIKIAVVLLFLDVMKGGHGKHKHNQAALNAPPQQQSLPAPVQYAAPQPQLMSPQQALTYPAPYLSDGGQSASYPTPLQTALNMP